MQRSGGMLLHYVSDSAMLKLSLVLYFSITFSAVKGLETCLTNYNGDPSAGAICSEYCCGTSSNLYCCTDCSKSYYSSKSCGLSVGAIVGIVLGSVAGVALVVVGVILVLHYVVKKRIKVNVDSEGTVNYSHNDDQISQCSYQSNSSAQEVIVIAPPNYNESDGSQVHSIPTVTANRAEVLKPSVTSFDSGDENAIIQSD